MASLEELNPTIQQRKYVTNGRAFRRFVSHSAQIFAHQILLLGIDRYYW